MWERKFTENNRKYGEKNLIMAFKKETLNQLI